jgi:hypothetical protein
MSIDADATTVRRQHHSSSREQEQQERIVAQRFVSMSQPRNVNITNNNIMHPREEKEEKRSSSPRPIGNDELHGKNETKMTTTSILPLSMRILRAAGCGCQYCHVIAAADNNDDATTQKNSSMDQPQDKNDHPVDALQQRKFLSSSSPTQKVTRLWEQNHLRSRIDDSFSVSAAIHSLTEGVSPWVVEPMLGRSVTTANPTSSSSSSSSVSIETILWDYKTICHFYSVSPNAGVIATVRYALPCLRTAMDDFQDGDMLALSELLLLHTSSLSYVRKLDLRKERARKVQGFGSHGAFALAKLLQNIATIQEIDVTRNRIGPFGAAAIFMAASNHPQLRIITMRRCRISEKGAVALAKFVLDCDRTNQVRAIDVSVNHIGYRGCLIIERAHAERTQRRQKRHVLQNETTGDDPNDSDDNSRDNEDDNIQIDLDGNLVFQEIMNGVTHGLGILLAMLGAWMLSAALEDKDHVTFRHRASCGVYSTSLVVLYSSSTLFHSFFSLRGPHYFFSVS